MRRNGSRIILENIAEWDIGWQGDYCRLYIYFTDGTHIAVYESEGESPYQECAAKFTEITGFDYQEYLESTYHHNNKESRWLIFLQEQGAAYEA